MDYLKPKFSLHIGSTLSDREYEIRVGARCAECGNLTESCICKKFASPEALKLLNQLEEK